MASSERPPEPLLPTDPPAGVRVERMRLVHGELFVFSHPIPGKGDRLARLTGAELAVFRLLLSGRSTATIASRRGTTLRTIGKQIDSIYKKLGVHSRAELAARFG